VDLLADDDNSNTGIDSLGFGANDRPNVVGNPKLSNPSANEWFNTSAFAIPPYGSFGNSGRNTVEGPGMATVDLSLVKNTTIRERRHGAIPRRRHSTCSITRTSACPTTSSARPRSARFFRRAIRAVQLGLKLLF
jgi:hypothetical protein